MVFKSNLYHAQGKFNRQQFVDIIFADNRDSQFMQILEQIKNIIFQNVVCGFDSLTALLACVIIIFVNIKWSTAEVKAIIIPISQRELDCQSDDRNPHTTCCIPILESW